MMRIGLECTCDVKGCIHRAFGVVHVATKLLNQQPMSSFTVELPAGWDVEHQLLVDAPAKLLCPKHAAKPSQWSGACWCCGDVAGPWDVEGYCEACADCDAGAPKCRPPDNEPRP